MTVPQVFDSLIAKLIVTGASRTQALQRAARALAEFEVGGMPTVLPFHRAVVTDPAFAGEPLRVHTRWIETEFDSPMPPQEPAATAEPADRETITVEVGESGSRWCVPAGLRAPGPPPGGPEGGGPPAGEAHGVVPRGDALLSPMQGTIIKITVEEGQRVSAGDVVVVLEAMKMEQPLTAHKDGTVTGLSVAVGETVDRRRRHLLARGLTGGDQAPRGSRPGGKALFAIGVRLPERNREWVRHELTDAGWRGRLTLRHLAVMLPICVALALLPGAGVGPRRGARAVPGLQRGHRRDIRR